LGSIIVKAVIIASGGVAEGNEEEPMLQKRIVKIAKQSSMRIIGIRQASLILERVLSAAYSRCFLNHRDDLLTGGWIS
jgi:acyl-CoA synthetase (NDP forming)